MTHEETADLLRSARAKILRNSIFRRNKQLKSNFAKILTESYPFRGWPQKQAVVYTSDIKREWFGATEGRDKPMAAWSSAAGYWPCTVSALRRHPHRRHARAWPKLLHADEHAPCQHHKCASLQDLAACKSPPADRAGNIGRSCSRSEPDTGFRQLACQRPVV
ncbi:hypothetical protein [Mesorhizobium sp. DCY119]|uniref:hypothetical protein n=1 Tax=Mesorhizobium sp. DCY119 TaxID=2108445 RepID=UPI001FE1BA01|nr:hypothetical protein [Mesorhizobium sp. DCY119]